jgi:hypothetical protein
MLSANVILWWNWIVHILCRNCRLRHVIERNIDGKIRVRGRRGRRSKKLLVDRNKKIKHWKLKVKALDRTLWKTRFGRGHGPVVRQPAVCMGPHTYGIKKTTTISYVGVRLGNFSLHSIEWFVGVTELEPLPCGSSRIFNEDSSCFRIERLFHESRKTPLASHRGGPCLIPGQSLWVSCWKEWHWDRVFPWVDFPLSVSFHQYSTLL